MKDFHRLYELLPVVHRQRDAERGGPLAALLQVIGEQVDIIEKDIDRLYNNWFIETCEDWVVPYIADLVGYRAVHQIGGSGDAALHKALYPRAEVANVIASRRRKGTLALLELLANDVAGWPARAVEAYKLLGWTQHLNHLRLHRGRTVEIRNENLLELLAGPFDRFAHTADLRRISSPRSQGRYNLPNIAMFVWRLQAYSVTGTPAYCLEEEGARCYSFSILGNDTPLYHRPQRETDATVIARELNLPIPIRRRALEKRIAAPGQPERVEASADYYGREKSLAIWAPNWPQKGAPQPIPKESVIPANLSGWRYRVPRNFVAVDPQLGRIAFPQDQRPKEGVRVVYHYAFSADIGGGEYPRQLRQPAGAAVLEVGRADKFQFHSINEALTHWQELKQTLRPPPAEGEKLKPVSVVIEIGDSGVYTEPMSIALDENESLQLRAANRTRPVLRLLDYLADQPEAFSVSGAKGSRFTLDGLLIAGRGLSVRGPETTDDHCTKTADDLCDVTIRHCTLVPGWTLDRHCQPKHPSEPGIVLHNTTAHVKISYSIFGAIEVFIGDHRVGSIHLEIADSIWDATSHDLPALRSPDAEIACAHLTIKRSTVLGKILSHEIALAENSIFTGEIFVARQQSGCVRFCYVPPGSRTPRRYHCEPDAALAAIEEKFTAGEISRAEHDSALESEPVRVVPRFNSVRYGTPTYCQLADSCAEEIKRGADDESEMGAFHDLFQPQRAESLGARLNEFTPAGLSAGIVHAT
jgi:hypothetical protein